MDFDRDNFWYEKWLITKMANKNKYVFKMYTLREKSPNQVIFDETEAGVFIY